MSDEFELVERPAGAAANVAPELMNAILKTVDSDQAVKIKTFEGEFLSFQGKMRMAARKYGLKLRFRRVKRTKEIYVWAEKVEDIGMDPVDELENLDDDNDTPTS